MCGICGIFNFRSEDAPAIKQHTEKMSRLLTDRGPDHQSIWQDSFVTLGHTRLAIMDPGNSAANQPIHTEQWAIVFNGEIYNFRELRKDLETRGFSFSSNSDTEVLIKTVEAYGINEALNRLNGIFAFCAYNKVERKIYLARDRLGVKPLYYWLDSKNSHFWFSSTPSAIADVTNKPWVLNQQAVFSHFHLGAPITRSTFFSGINRLRPAELVTVDANLNIEHSYFWEPQFRTGDLNEQIVESILGEKEAHVASAVFLSGGVDSSLISAILENVEAFHLSSPELIYAEYVANKLGIKLRVREYTSDVSFDDLLEKYAISSGEASASSPIPLMVSELIASEGYKVAFSANGADELFFGYPRTPTPELLPHNYPAVDYEDLSVMTTDDQYYHIFRDERSIHLPGYSPKSIKPGDTNKLYDLRTLNEEFPESATQRWFELQTYVGADLLPTLDFAGMACSLEVRVPFLDYKLVELALSTDANQLLSADYGRKTHLKKLLKAYGFNPALWSRQKIGFSIPKEINLNRERSIGDHISSLKNDGLFRMGVSTRYTGRDYQYLNSAAHAFNIWKRVWIDTGKVVLNG